MAKLLNVALAQMESVMGDIPKNIEKTIDFCEKAVHNGSQLIVFPELSLTGYNQEIIGESLNCLAMDADDEKVQRLARAAKELNICIMTGFVQKSHIPGVFFNSIICIDDDGKIAGSYAKSHLFAGEVFYFRAGNMPEVIQTDIGRIGPMICMDIGFPEVARILALQGSDFLCASSAWIEEDSDIWKLSLQSRALDNISFVIGVNHPGNEGQLHYVGNSMIVNPRGKVINQLDNKEGILFDTIDLEEMIVHRKRAPRFLGRRPEIYKDISDPLKNYVDTYTLS